MARHQYPLFLHSEHGVQTRSISLLPMTCPLAVGCLTRPTLHDDVLFVLPLQPFALWLVRSLDHPHVLVLGP